MAEYIEREALIDDLNHFAPEHYNALINMLIEKQPAADVVEVETLEAWLYKMAMNNDVYFADVCEEIISRLDGLRYFQRERRSE